MRLCDVLQTGNEVRLAGLLPLKLRCAVFGKQS